MTERISRTRRSRRFQPGLDGANHLEGRLLMAGDYSGNPTIQQALEGSHILPPQDLLNVSRQGPLGGSAFNYGDQFAKDHGDDGDANEAARHAYWSAWMYMKYGEETATAIGNIHETYGSDAAHLADSARDQWTNDVGRRIGKQVYDEGYWWTDSRDARIKELIEKAWQDGELMKGEDDPRIEQGQLIEKERQRQEQQRVDDAARHAREADAALRSVN